MRDTTEAPDLHPQLAGFGGVEFMLQDERYGITEEALAERYAGGAELEDVMRVFRHHAHDIAAHAPRWARRRRGGLLMIFRDDVERQNARPRREAAQASG